MSVLKQITKSKWVEWLARVSLLSRTKKEVNHISMLSLTRFSTWILDLSVLSDASELNDWLWFWCFVGSVDAVRIGICYFLSSRIQITWKFCCRCYRLPKRSDISASSLIGFSTCVWILEVIGAIGFELLWFAGRVETTRIGVCTCGATPKRRPSGSVRWHRQVRMSMASTGRSIFSWMANCTSSCTEATLRYTLFLMWEDSSSWWNPN